MTPEARIRSILLRFGAGCTNAGSLSAQQSGEDMAKASAHPEDDRMNPGSCPECLEAAVREIVQAAKETKP